MFDNNSPSTFSSYLWDSPSSSSSLYYTTSVWDYFYIFLFIFGIILCISFLIGICCICSTQTIMKRLYFGYVFGIFVEYIIIYFTFDRNVYNNFYYCQIFGSLWVASTLYHSLYLFAIIFTILLTLWFSKSGDIDYLKIPIFWRFYYYEIWCHVLILFISMLYGVLSSAFIGDLGGTCFLQSAMNRFLIYAIVVIIYGCISLGLLVTSWILYFTSDNKIINPNSDNNDELSIGGCFCCSYSFSIHLLKELIVISIIFIIEILWKFTLYLMFLFPYPLLSDIFYFIYIILPIIICFILFCCYILCNCFYWKSLIHGGLCCLIPKNSKPEIIESSLQDINYEMHDL